MRQILVLKNDGTAQPYDHRKAVSSVVASGFALTEAEDIISLVEGKLYNRIPTKELYRLVGAVIRQRGSLRQHSLYRLREALSEVDSLKFEKYMTEVLAAHGYQSSWNHLIKGAGVEHQVDAVAQKGSELWLVEMKHHVDWHKMSGLGQVLQVQARLEDIQEGYRQKKSQFNFTGAWIINNTKFSQHAQDYAAYKKIKLSGWHTSRINEESLENLIQDKALYPVTVLPLNKADKLALQNKDLVTVQDILNYSGRPRLSLAWSEIVRQAQDVLDGKD